MRETAFRFRSEQFMLDHLNEYVGQLHQRDRVSVVCVGYDDVYRIATDMVTVGLKCTAVVENTEAQRQRVLNEIYSAHPAVVISTHAIFLEMGMNMDFVIYFEPLNIDSYIAVKSSLWPATQELTSYIYKHYGYAEIFVQQLREANPDIIIERFN